MKKMKQGETLPDADNVEIVDESSVPTSNKSVRFKRGLILLFLALLVGGIAYVLTPFLLPYLTKASIVQEDEIISVNENFKTEEVVVPLAAEEENAPLAPLTQEEKETLSVDQEKDDTVVEEKNVLPEPVKVEKAVVSEQKTQQVRIPLVKVIQLYDAFQKGAECRSLLEELIVLSKDNPEMEKNLMTLLGICLENPLSEQMQQAFYKDKKRAILRILQSENPTWTAYLKMIPYSIVDIYKKNVLSDAPMDVLYAIQNAVEDNKFSQVLKLIAKLPENVQPALYDLQQCALREVTIANTLQNVIQTLAQGEEDE